MCGTATETYVFFMKVIYVDMIYYLEELGFEDFFPYVVGFINLNATLKMWWACVIFLVVAFTAPEGRQDWLEVENP